MMPLIPPSPQAYCLPPSDYIYVEGLPPDLRGAEVPGMIPNSLRNYAAATYNESPTTNMPPPYPPDTTTIYLAITMDHSTDCQSEYFPAPSIGPRR